MSATVRRVSTRDRSAIALALGVLCAVPTSFAQQSSDSAQTGTMLREVIVTAEKKREPLQDVPIPVAVLTSSDLLSSNQLRLQDYFSQIPGLTLQTTGSGQQQIAIRGITTGGLASPTVGVSIDDVPIGSSSVLALGNNFVPDIDPSDLGQIEVLRGPQGTLYGASSIGGLIKYQTVDPSLAGYSGRAETDLESVHSSDALGYVVRGNVNLPMSDTIAVRVSGFNRRDPSFVNSAQTNVTGGRLSSVWKPGDNLTVNVSAMLQDTHGYSLSAEYPEFSSTPLHLLPNTGQYDQRFRLYTVNVQGRVGQVNLTSVSGYGITSINQTYDDTPYAGFFADLLFGTPTASGGQFWQTKKFTQEFRASTTLANHVDLLLGVFYDHEASFSIQLNDAASPASGIPTESLLYINSPTTYSEIAGFGDATIHFTEAFDVQIGARLSNIRQNYREFDIGPLDEFFYGLPSPAIVPPIVTTDRPFTYLFTPRYRISPDLMLYLRLASGYRAGAPNFEATLFKEGIPHAFNSDKTQDYEIGVKSSALDRRLTLDASLYYIKWKDLQIQVLDPSTGFPYTANAGNAKSQGVEFSAQMRPIENTSIAGWVTYNDAVLTQPLPPNSSAVAAAGSRLPYSSRYSGNFSLEQSFPLSGGWEGRVGATASYIGQREDIFPGTGATRNSMGGYTNINFHTGVEHGSWHINLFVNNVTNRRGVIGLSQYGYGGPVVPNFIQPRTVGLSLEKLF